MGPLKFSRILRQWRKQHPIEKSAEISLSDSHVALLSDEDEYPSVKSDRCFHKPNSFRFWAFFNLVLLCIHIALAYLQFHLLKPHQTEQDIGSAIRATSYYSPILNNIEPTLHTVKLNGTLWPPKTPSWQRAEPHQPAIEAIWESFEPGSDYSFAITREDVIGLGKDPDLAVVLPNESSPNRYIASFDSLHKTHCLNELRKMTFENYGAKAETKIHRHGRFWWVHLRHCVDMLMQDQLCHADADMIIYNWVDTQKYPWPDMSINRKCRSWEQLMEWGSRHVVDRETIMGLEKGVAEGVVELPFERGYYEMYGFEDSTLFPNGTGYEW